MNSFRNRLLVLIIGLIAVTQTVTLVAVLESTRRSVESRAAEQLTAGTSYALQLVKFRASQLASGVAVLAADFGFREAVSSHDAPTILSAASNQSRRIDANLLLLVDTQGALIAATERVNPNFVASMDGLIDRALMSPETPHFALLSGNLYQFFAAPVKAPDTIAWLVMGFAVNDSLARKIGDLVGVDVSFIALDGAVARNVASTLNPRLRDLMPLLPEMNQSGVTVPGNIRTGEDEFLVHVVDLEPDNHAVRLLLQKPSQQVLAPFLAVRNAMLVVSGTALLLAMIVAVLLGRSATRPIDELVGAARPPAARNSAGWQAP
jgi:hypothetical protein